MDERQEWLRHVLFHTHTHSTAVHSHSAFCCSKCFSECCLYPEYIFMSYTSARYSYYIRRVEFVSTVCAVHAQECIIFSLTENPELNNNVHLGESERDRAREIIADDLRPYSCYIRTYLYTLLVYNGEELALKHSYNTYKQQNRDKQFLCIFHETMVFAQNWMRISCITIIIIIVKLKYCFLKVKQWKFNIFNSCCLSSWCVSVCVCVFV